MSGPQYPTQLPFEGVNLGNGIVIPVVLDSLLVPTGNKPTTSHRLDQISKGQESGFVQSAGCFAGADCDNQHGQSRKPQAAT